MHTDREHESTQLGDTGGPLAIADSVAFESALSGRPTMLHSTRSNAQLRSDRKGPLALGRTVRRLPWSALQDCNALVTAPGYA